MVSTPRGRRRPGLEDIKAAIVKDRDAYFKEFLDDFYFRDAVSKIDVPVLVVHGTEDRILPFEATVRRLPGLVQDLTFVQVEAVPHNIGWKHHDEVNKPVGVPSRPPFRSGRVCRSEAKTSRHSSSAQDVPHASTTTEPPTGRSRSA